MPEGYVPPALENKPICWPENEEVLDAFLQLSVSRISGMNGESAIQMTEIEAYGRLFEIEDMRDFFQRIRAADMAYFDWRKQQAAARGEK